MFYVSLFLTLLSGISWTLVYTLSIREELRSHVTAMPFLALALNIAWEGLYTVTGLADSLTNVQAWVNLVWVGFDVVLLVLYFKYSPEEFDAPKKYFVPWSVLGLVISVAMQIVFMFSFGNFDLEAAGLTKFGSLMNTNLGCWYSAYLQNLAMSFLYIAMFIRRRGTKGQTKAIAVSKCIGTLAPTIQFGMMFGNKLVLVTGLCILVLDIIYIWMLGKGERFFKE